MNTVKKITALASLLLFAACDKEPMVTAELAVSKTVQFQVWRGNDYSAPIFNGLKAEIRLSISKESTSTGSNTVVWDTTFAMRDIQTYPPFSSPITFSKKVEEVFPSKEAVRISRVVNYKDGQNNVRTEAVGTVIPKTDELTLIAVSL